MLTIYHKPSRHCKSNAATSLPGKPIGFLFIIILIVLLQSISLPAQNVLSGAAIQSYDQLGLIFIPAEWDKSVYGSLEAEIADLFTITARSLKRFFVADWLVVDDIIYEEDLLVPQNIDDSMALQFGELAGMDEVFLFEIVRFAQVGVPPDDDDDDDSSFFTKLVVGFIKLLFSKVPEYPEDGLYADNMQTTVEIAFTQIDVANAEISQQFFVFAEHTGGNRDESKIKAFSALSERIQEELKRTFLLTPGIQAIRDRQIIFDLGANMGIQKGDLYEIVEPDRRQIIAGEEQIFAGKKVGLAQVVSVDESNSAIRLLRQWAPLDTTFQALEFTSDWKGLILNTSAPLLRNYWSLGMQLNWRPIHPLDGGGGLRILRKTDSFDQADWGFGFGGYGSWRFLHLYKLTLQTRLDMDVDFFIRRDDQDDWVNTALFSISPGVQAEILLSRRRDLVLTAGYRFFGSSNSWQKFSDEDEEAQDAVWIDRAPRLDISGFYINIGYRFILF